MKSKSTNGPSVASVVPRSGLLVFIVKQFREVLPPTLFFMIGFNLIVLTTQLILADYLIHFANFMLVTISALVLGKSVLVAKALPFFRRFDTAPIAQPVLFKTSIYFAVVFVVRFFEKLGKYWFAGGTFSGIPEYVAKHFSWNRWQGLWLFDEVARDRAFAPGVFSKAAADPFAHAHRGRIDNRGDAGRQAVAAEVASALAGGSVCGGAGLQHGPAETRLFWKIDRWEFALSIITMLGVVAPP
jgi:hypothetical protein